MDAHPVTPWTGPSVASLISPRAGLARMAAAIAGLLWVLPFVLGIAHRPMLFFYPEWVAAALGMLACAYLLWAQRPLWYVPWSALFMLALAVYVALQPTWVTVAYAETSRAYACYLLWAALLVWLGAALREELGSNRLMTILAWCAFTGGLLGACTGLLQKYGGPHWLESWAASPTPSGEVYGNIRHRSYYADHIMLGVVAGVHLAANGKLRAGWLMASALVTVPAMALAVSRGSLLCLLLVLGLVLWQQRAQRHGARLITLSVLLHLLLYLLAPAYLPWLEPYARVAPAGELADVFDRLGQPEDIAGLGVRLTLWRAALEGVLQTPWWGQGPDAFAWVYYQFSHSANVLPYTIHSHNLPLQMALSFGLPVAAAFLAWGAYWFWQCRQRLICAELLFLTGTLLVVGQRALLDLPLWIAPFLGITALLVGAGEGHGAVIRSRRRRLDLVRRAFLGACLLAGALLLFSTMRDYQHVSSLWLKRQDARTLTMRYREARDNVFLTPVVDSIHLDAMRLDSPRAPRYLSLSSRVFRWRPYPRATFRHSAFLALNERHAAACAMAARATLVYPQHVAWFEKQLDGARSAHPSLPLLRNWVDRFRHGDTAEAVCAPFQPTAAGKG